MSPDQSRPTIERSHHSSGFSSLRLRVLVSSPCAPLRSVFRFVSLPCVCVESPHALVRIAPRAVLVFTRAFAIPTVSRLFPDHFPSAFPSTFPSVFPTASDRVSDHIPIAFPSAFQARFRSRFPLLRAPRFALLTYSTSTSTPVASYQTT